MAVKKPLRQKNHSHKAGVPTPAEALKRKRGGGWLHSVKAVQREVAVLHSWGEMGNKEKGESPCCSELQRI